MNNYTNDSELFKGNVESLKIFKEVATSDLLGVWALIVCFHPGSRLLLNLAASLVSQVSKIFILNNGGIDDVLKKDLLCIDNVIFHDFDSNVGIARALNKGFSSAVEKNAEFVVTFDQDSCPESKHVAILVEKWRSLSSTAGNKGKIGAIGPCFYDARNGNFDYPFYVAKGFKVVKQFPDGKESIVKADALITSGMLVPTKMWSDGLSFKELLFIDFVDTEWCFRATQAGYLHYGCFDVKMKHELSEASPIMFFGLIVLKYSPLRRYYHFRNCLYLVSRPYVPLVFKVRLTLGLVLRFLTLPFVDDKPLLSFRSVMGGVLHAAMGRYGRRKS
jgi:rhamnosyltransferase